MPLVFAPGQYIVNPLHKLSIVWQQLACKDLTDTQIHPGSMMELIRIQHKPSHFLMSVLWHVWLLLKWGGRNVRLVTWPLLQAIHHPFTAPSSDYLEGRCSSKDATALAYDLVLNGCEIGGSLPTLRDAYRGCTKLPQRLVKSTLQIDQQYKRQAFGVQNGKLSYNKTFFHFQPSVFGFTQSILLPGLLFRWQT